MSPDPVGVPDWLLNLAYLAYYRANDFNHEHRLWFRSKRAHGVQFRSYEPLTRHTRDGLLGALCARLAPGEVVLDVGANTGVYTLATAATDPTVEVVAFEPNPKVADQLLTNVVDNGFAERVTVREAGIADRTGTAPFYVSSYAELGSFRRDNAALAPARVAEVITVPVRRLDDLYATNGIPAPDHLKIDVEGVGTEVLAGAERLLTRERPTVYFEPHGAPDVEALVQSFEVRGYDRERVAEGWVFDP